MDDIYITIISIGAAVILIVVFPLMTIANRTDDTAQLAVETAVREFVDQSCLEGKITQANLDKLEQSITASTDRLYNVELVVTVPDANLGKKTAQTSHDKVGENVSFNVYTSEIKDKIKNAGYYSLTEGSMLSADAKSETQGLAEMMEKVVYFVSGNDAYRVHAQYARVVPTNGN